MFALEEQTTHLAAELETTKAELATITGKYEEEKEGRAVAEVAKSAFRMLKNKYQAEAENKTEELDDANENLASAKRGRARANAAAAEGKVRLALAKKDGGGGGRRGAGAEEDDGTQPYVSDARIMDGTLADVVPYQKGLTEEYHAASVALKKTAGG